MPWWSALDDDRKYLDMTIPEFQQWCHYGEGTWWAPRIRVKRQILAAWEKQQYGKRKGGKENEETRDARMQAEGWQGGYTDPLDSCEFIDADINEDELAEDY